MKSTHSTAAIVVTLALLSGCASMQPDTALSVKPSLKVGHSDESSVTYYALGRLHHLAGRHEQAQQAYARAIELDGRHSEAHNALGILYAERQDYPAAVAVLREAVRLDPSNSQLQSNLGFALYLSGDHAQAASALAEAVRLDPNNVYARNNLAVVNKLSGRIEPAPEPAAKASGRPDAKKIPGKSETSGPAPDDRVSLRQVGASIYAVDLPPVALQTDELAPTPVTPTRHVKSAVPAPARLEISNGNGVLRMARAVATILAGGNMQVVRLTNQARFDVQATRIEYRAGYEATARALATRLGTGNASLHRAAPGSRSDLRLILGHDLPPVTVLRVRYETPRGAPGDNRGSKPSANTTRNSV